MVYGLHETSSFRAYPVQPPSVLSAINWLGSVLPNDNYCALAKISIWVYSIASIVMTIANSIQVAHKDDESLLKDDAI